MAWPAGTTRALLGGLLLTLLVIGLCFTAYPPGSAEYDEPTAAFTPSSATIPSPGSARWAALAGTYCA